MIHCQFALYTLRTAQIEEVLEAALSEVSASGFEIKVGKMSTELQGEAAQVFAALQAAYQRAAQMGQVVMTVTISNAC
ncbi:MAG: YkoF family thiamine/hydroxymethylpyrimidine-binding protein [Chloroflexota bacterium]